MRYPQRVLPFVLALLPAAAALADLAPSAATACTITQVTASAGSDSFAGGLSADGRLLALSSRADLTGANPDHSRELFVYDRTTQGIVQLTDLLEGFVHQPTFDADGSHVFYRSNVDPGTGALLPAPREVLVRLDRSSGDREVVARDFLDVAVSAGGGHAALLSEEDPTGGNADGNAEIFLLDLASGAHVQVTDTVEAVCPPFPGTCPGQFEPAIDADGSHVAFYSDLDPTASGDASVFGGVFVYDAGSGLTTRLTVHASPEVAISGDGRSVAFPSIENLSGDNPDRWIELFVHRAAPDGFRQVPGQNRFLHDPVDFDRAGSRLVFNAVPRIGSGRDAFLYEVGPGVVAPLLAAAGVDDFAVDATPDGAWISLHSKANLQGGNPDGSFEVFLASCADEAVPPPPPGDWLTTGEFPDFRFKVRITAGGEEQPARMESDCLPETLCISGAVLGRSEIFVRIVGPKPNGKLWPNLVRFSTSTIELWIEQLSTEVVKYYRLEGASPGSSDLSGLFDRDGFVP